MERGEVRPPLRVLGPTQVEEAPGWSRQGDDADSWKSVESANWEALRGAEKAHAAKDRGRRFFLGMSGHVQNLLNPLKSAGWEERPCIKGYISGGDED